MPSGASCCGAKRSTSRQFRKASRDWFAPPIDAPVPLSANLTCFRLNPARVRGTMSSTQLLTAVVMFVVWVYAFIDAPLSAAARNRLV